MLVGGDRGSNLGPQDPGGFEPGQEERMLRRKKMIPVISVLVKFSFLSIFLLKIFAFNKIILLLKIFIYFILITGNNFFLNVGGVLKTNIEKKRELRAE